VIFGSQPTAVKSFVVILLISCIIWVLYTFNFSIPKLNFKLEKYSKPKSTKSKTSNNSQRQTNEDIAKKINQSDRSF
jgi:uncharacterized membrane protein YfhO